MSNALFSKKISAAFFLFFVFFAGAHAELTVDSFFGEHMVLQRESRVAIWGKSSPNAGVTVSFSGKTVSAKSDAGGKWEVVLPPLPTNTTPEILEIRSDGEVVRLADILVGDVWICAGQSNMEWPLSRDKDAKAALAGADLPAMRLLNYSYPGQYKFGAPFSAGDAARFAPEKFFQGEWNVASAKSAAPFSAVGFYFGKKINTETGVPVGLVNYAIGGSPIETWIAFETLKRDARFREKTKSDWLKNPALDSWVRQRAGENTKSISEKIMFHGMSPAHPYAPGTAFECGPARIERFPVKGFLWYQGESNSQEEARVAEYPALFKLMVDDWRKRRRQPDAPFLWVQLSSIDTKHYKSQFWPRFRDGQRRVLGEIKNGGMAVSSDAGAVNDVHPRAKKIVGERLAAWALSAVYGKNVVPAGPLPAVVSVIAGGALRVTFDYADGLCASDGEALSEFEVAGADGKFFPATAVIAGASVTVRADAVPAPKKVRYAWVPFSKGNLANAVGFAASTFEMSVDK